MEWFQPNIVDYKNYKISFRRRLVGEIDKDSMSIYEARQRFHIHPVKYHEIIKLWQDRYSDEIHLSLSTMSTKQQSYLKKLEQRIKKLE